MKKKILILDNITIDKRRFHYPKNPIWIDDIYILLIFHFNKISFGKEGYKYFIGCKNNEKVIDCV